jgi:hypothetical protein
VNWGSSQAWFGMVTAHLATSMGGGDDGFELDREVTSLA